MTEPEEKMTREKAYIPQITIDVNLNDEVEIFYYGLHNTMRPWQRKIILGIRDFQPLRHSLETNNALDEDQEKQIIGDFLKRFREHDKDKIDEFITRSQRELEEKSKPALAAMAAMAALMDYEWPEDFPGYRVVPVLLPFSPFGKNVFYFSILRVAQGVDQKDLLDVAVHEISHMVFYEILAQSHPEFVNYQDSHTINTPIDYLKEILAPVLINQPSLKQFLDLSHYPNGYMGNTDLEQIYVQVEGANEKVQISKYFQQLYEKMRHQEHRSFPEIMDEMIKLVQPMEDELVKRRSLWNEYQFKIFRDKTLLDQYSEPISIKE